MKVQVDIQHLASGSCANITCDRWDSTVWLPPKATKDEAIHALTLEAFNERKQAKVHIIRAERIEAAVKELEKS